MSKQKSSDLKKRLADLRINEPLRLSKPNELARSTCVDSRNEVPHSEAPRISNHQNELTQKEAARCGVAPREQTQIQVPHAEQAHPEEGGNGVAEIELTSIKNTHSEQSQNEQPPIEKAQKQQPQIELAQNEKTHEASQGFFKLSHSVFLQPLLRELSGDCFRLFLWLSCRAWRFPDSDGTVRASVGYMESHTGMGHATISRGLRSLKETGLVSLEEVNFKRGNLWRIIPLALGNFDPENGPTRFKEPQKEVPKNRLDAASKRGGGSLSLSKKPPQIEQQIININKQKLSEESAIDQTQFEAALFEFETNVPKEKQETITQEFTAREYPHGIFPPAVVIKKLAAMEWFGRQERAILGQVG